MTSLNKKKNAFLSFVDRNTVQTVAFIPVVAAALLVTGWIILAQNNFVDRHTVWDSIVLSIAAFLVGLTGVVYIYKKEMPGYVSTMTIKGKWAVISGWLIVLWFWGLGLAILFLD